MTGAAHSIAVGQSITVLVECPIVEPPRGQRSRGSSVSGDFGLLDETRQSYTPASCRGISVSWWSRQIELGAWRVHRAGMVKITPGFCLYLNLWYLQLLSEETSTAASNIQHSKVHVHLVSLAPIFLPSQSYSCLKALVLGTHLHCSCRQYPRCRGSCDLLCAARSTGTNLPAVSAIQMLRQNHRCW